VADRINAPRIVVSASGTGAGKTLVTMALCAVLRDRGLRVRAFKTGPDYVDARLYESILGRRAQNLDLWLDGEPGVLRHVAATAPDADVVVIEGMMGLFDGDDEGATSTALLAKVLDASIVSVIDTWSSSQSAAAVALGLRAYAPELRHAGIILNRVGGDSHAAAVRKACSRAGIEVLAAIPHREAYVMPERTLGLSRHAFEARAQAVRPLAEELASQLDVDALLARASSPLPAAVATERRATRAVVAVAEDDAFWFTYPETLDALEAAGARIVLFSPLHDADLPRDLDALWIGGGYPEDYAPELEGNVAMRGQIRAAIDDGVPTYAECGGLMYLAERLHDAEGTFAMVGALKGETSIAHPRLHIGYREAALASDSPLGLAGSPVRGYEFHYATPMLEPQPSAYVHKDGEDGAVRKNCLAAFLHRHFLPGDKAIERFIASTLVVVFALVVAGCGGGGGGGGSAPPPTIGPSTPTPTPVPTSTATSVPTSSGFVPASGPITTLAAVTGNFGTTLLPSSSDGAFIVQSGNNPAGSGFLSGPSAIGQYTISAQETGGLSTSSVARFASLQTIAAHHQAMAADRLRELPPALIGVERIVASLPRGPGGPAPATQAVRVTKANLGDQKTFKVLYSGIGGAATQCPNPNVGSYTCYVNVPATLKAIGAHSYVWVDNTSLANPNEFPDNSYFTTTASNFDNYFNIESQQFGPVFASANIGPTTYNQCDSNGQTLPTSQWETTPDMTGRDPHVNIVITEALAGTGEGGYFYSGDEFAQQVLNCSGPPRAVSNEVPMFVIGSDNYGAPPAGVTNLPQYNPTYWLNTDMPRSMSHELQHLIHSMNKYYTRLATGQSAVQDDAWIDEGSSMLAEDLAANGMQIDTPRYSYGFMLEPSDFSLTSFVGYQPNPLSTTGTGPYGYYYYTAGNYGMAYLFLRYIYDRFGGANAMHAIYADFRTGTVGKSNVNPILAAAGNEPWPQLYNEWATAVAAQSGGVTTDPRYTFTSGIVLRGTVVITTRRSSPTTRTLVFGGPQPPESFDASGNLIGYIPFTIGSSPSWRAIDGASNFLLPQPSGSGTTVRAQTGSLPNSQGGIVQGNMPTPMPTSI
jgi:cobyrinic acid a,c-diamide synthase